MLDIRFITLKRQHLFKLSAILAEGMKDYLLNRRKGQVVVSVLGSYRDGKKIIPDSAVQSLLGVRDARRTRWNNYVGKVIPGITSFSGNVGFDEYWNGSIKGKKIAVTFLDAAYTKGYSDERLNQYPRGGKDTTYSIAKEFLEARQDNREISFVHNCPRLAQAGASVIVRIEKDQAFNMFEDESRVDALPLPLKRLFGSVSTASYLANEDRVHWVRAISIEVKDDNLLESTSFRHSLSLLQAKAPIFGMSG